MKASGTIEIFYQGKERKIPYSYYINYDTPEIVIDDINGHSYHFSYNFGRWKPSGGLTKRIPDDMKEMLYERFAEIMARHH